MLWKQALLPFAYGEVQFPQLLYEMQVPKELTGLVKLLLQKKLDLMQGMAF